MYEAEANENSSIPLYPNAVLLSSLFLKLGGEEVEYDPGFQLYLQTKLSNPHYKPEIAAQVNMAPSVFLMVFALSRLYYKMPSTKYTAIAGRRYQSCRQMTLSS